MIGGVPIENCWLSLLPNCPGKQGEQVQKGSRVVPVTPGDVRAFLAGRLCCFACPTTHENQFSPDPNPVSLGDTTAANCTYYAHKEADLRANAYPGANAL
jgi:hypothetical protein